MQLILPDDQFRGDSLSTLVEELKEPMCPDFMKMKDANTILATVQIIGGAVDVKRRVWWN